MGFLNIRKWAAKTASLVERVCNREKGIPIGVGIVFYDPAAPAEEMYRFVIKLAGDPNETTTLEERKRIASCIEYIMAGVKYIYEGGAEPDHSPESNKRLN